MFYSYKNFPITIESFNISGVKNSAFGDYTFIAQNINLNINPNADFTFNIDNKKPYRGINKEGLTSTVQINFLSQVPYDYMFLNNIFSESGIKNNFKLRCGDSIFESGYLRSYGFSINPHSVINNQAEFVFFQTGLNEFTGNLGLSNFTVSSDDNSFFPHASNTLIAFNDSYNEFNKHDIRRIEFNYSAEIEPIYNINTIYPYRVIYNREQIDLNIDLDVYKINIRDINNIIDGTKIILTGNGQSASGIQIYLRSGYLLNKNLNSRVNDIINSRISLRYYI